MKGNLFIFLLLLLSTFFVFGNNLDVFFAQDDYILIDKFSQNLIAKDFINVFSWNDTHFRPVHNLYLLILGNLLGKNSFFYHIAALVIHASVGFLIFLICKKLIGGKFAAMSAGFFYVICSSHFVSLYWISGNAVEIGFLFFCISFLYWISKKYYLSGAILLLSILTSEAFFVSFLVIAAYEMLFREKEDQKRSLLVKYGLVLLFIAVIRLIYLTPRDLYETYLLEISIKTFSAVKYYVLRAFGFTEFSGDFVTTLLLILIYGVIAKRIIDMEIEARKLIFFSLLILLGLFPFILLPYHLSPHYINLSLFGISLFFAVALKSATKTNLIILLLLLFISSVGVKGYEKNSWVIDKSRIAEAYIKQIESNVDSTADDSTLIFNNNQISTSLDAYIALGGGKAIDFWFPEKNFKYCFIEFESCDALP